MDSSLGLNSSASFQGKWKFVNMTARTESIVEISDGIDIVKTVTISDYVTTKNAGTLEFDGSKMISTDLSYEVNTIATGYIYDNNALIDSVKVPFIYSVPSTSSTSAYTRVSADSISFSSGPFVNVGGATAPSGMKVQVVGDKLLLNLNASRVDIQNVFGVIQSTRESVKAVMTYQKQ